MMFGAWGNPDHDDSIRIIHRALDAGINFVDTADVYSAGRVRGDRRQGAQGRRDDVVLATKFFMPMGDGPEPQRRLAPLDHARGRELAAPARHRLHRPLPDAPPEPDDRRRGDPRRADRPRAAGQGPLHRIVARTPAAQIVEAQWAPSGAAWSGSSPSSRRTRSWSAASRRTSCPTAQRYGMGMLVYSPLRAAGSRAGGARTRRGTPTSAARPQRALRHDAARRTSASSTSSRSSRSSPSERDLTLIELAHRLRASTTPASPRAIIGPRTMEQLESQLAARRRRR